MFGKLGKYKIYPYTEIRDENLSPSKFVKFLYVCRSKSLITLKYIQLWRRKFCLQLIFFQLATIGIGPPFCTPNKNIATSKVVQMRLHCQIWSG